MTPSTMTPSFSYNIAPSMFRAMKEPFTVYLRSNVLIANAGLQRGSKQCPRRIFCWLCFPLPS
ncbi:hypothetical protein EXN66_Car000399 [Channa argus]|uniref:Uncharacterized protein n=1 Tax=Channa argus TaxID=215402 RepID=A0A6G1QYS3_CHAAH|nr:hypothetical protein EXN66_Car000399 [Channa argus]